MNQDLWRARMVLARWCAVGAALAAFGYLALSGTVPLWLPITAGTITAVAHGYWLRAPARSALTGPLTRGERVFQSTVAVMALGLAAAGLLTGASVIAAAAVSVTMLAGACACRHREIGFSALSALGIAILVVGADPPLFGIPVLLMCWALALGTIVLVVSLATVDRLRDRHPGILQPSTAPTGTAQTGTAQAELAQAAGRRAARSPLRATIRPLAISALFGLAALLIHPPTAGASGGAATGLLGQSGPQVGATYSSGPGMDLNARGELGDQQVARVPRAAPDHWRDRILADYDGRTFSPARAVPDLQVGQTATGGVRVAGLMSNGSPQGSSTTYQVEPLSPGPVIAPDNLTEMSIAPGELRLLPGSQLVPRGRLPNYTVTVVKTPAAASSGTAALAAGAETTDPQWLQLPNTVTARTRALARELTADLPTTEQQVRAIHDHLQTHYTYDLNAPRAPTGQDAVDHFLFDSGAGFCQHFAAAQTVLLRAAGIQARVATGFAFGTPDPQAPDRRLFSQRDSHAWTEVLIPGRGWVLSDATPPADTTRASFEATVHRAYNRVMADDHRRLLAASALAGVAGISWAMAVLWRRRRTRPQAPRDELEAAVDRLLIALHRAGRTSDPDETIRELAQRVPGAAPGLAAVERHLYSPSGLTTVELQDAVRNIRAEAIRWEEQSRRRRRQPVSQPA